MVTRRTGTVTGPRTLDHDASPAPQLVVLLRRDELSLPSSRHVLRGIDHIALGRADAFDVVRVQKASRRELQLRLVDDRISNEHLRITRQGAKWVVEDGGSRNGTYLDGERIERATLQDGSVLELGRTFVMFRDAVPLPPRLSADASEAELRPATPSWLTFHEPLQASYTALSRAAEGDLSVLVRGPTGSGKEIVAEGVHALSKRPGKLVPVNCATLSGELADATLFGHTRGAFTGAGEARQGLVRLADRGTLFLDELGELPLSTQAKLLRVLETRRVSPIGQDVSLPVGFRLISATLRDLDQAAADGTFRADLLSRTRQLEVLLPSLYARREDMGLLLRKLIADRAAALSREVVWAFLRHQYPQNIRELVHAVAQAHTLSGGERWELSHLPRSFSQRGLTKSEATPPKAEPDERQRRLIEALEGASGNVAEAARTLSVSRNTLHRWLRSWGLDPEAFRRK